VLALASVAGYFIRRAETTVSTIQSVSTPPPMVSLRTDDPPLNEDGQAVQTTSVDVDTQPAQQAMQDAGVDTGNSGGSLGGVLDRASNVSDLGKGALAAAGLNDKKLPSLNILLMGVDAR